MPLNLIVKSSEWIIDYEYSVDIMLSSLCKSVDLFGLENVKKNDCFIQKDVAIFSLKKKLYLKKVI